MTVGGCDLMAHETLAITAWTGDRFLAAMAAPLRAILSHVGRGIHRRGRWGDDSPRIV